MSRSPRFEICRDDDGWWARFRAANGRVVWVTETYTRRGAAENALVGLAKPFWCAAVLHSYDGRMSLRVDLYDTKGIEVREVDEQC